MKEILSLAMYLLIAAPVAAVAGVALYAASPVALLLLAPMLVALLLLAVGNVAVTSRRRP